MRLFPGPLAPWPPGPRREGSTAVADGTVALRGVCLLLTQGFGSGWVSSPCDPSDFGSILRSGSFQRKLCFLRAPLVRPGPFLTVNSAPSALCCYHGSNARGTAGTPVPGLLSALKGLWFSESPRERPGSFPPAVPLPLSPSDPKQLCPAAPLPPAPVTP